MLSVTTRLERARRHAPSHLFTVAVALATAAALITLPLTAGARPDRRGGPAETPASYELRWSASADRSPSEALAGADLSGAVHVFLQADQAVKWVVFSLDGVDRPADRTAPYDLEGGGLLADPLDATSLAPGAHEVRAVVKPLQGPDVIVAATFSVPAGTGTTQPGAGTLDPGTVDGGAGDPGTADGGSGSDGSPATAFGVVWSASSDGTQPSTLDGATVGGGLYAYASPATGLASVEFAIDGAVVRTERTAPFSLGGDNGPGKLLPYDTTRLAEGSHALATTFTLLTGEQQRSVATFTVSNPAPAVGSPLHLGSDIRKYLALPGGQTVVVPNGTYSAGWIDNAQHSDWLVLVAESPRGVVVNASLDLFKATKVVFVGFRFNSSLVRVYGGSDIVFWYCEGTFPAETWTSARASRPTSIWAGSANGSGPAARVRILGSDIHDVGDDGIQIGDADDGEIAGTRVWGADEKVYDPADHWHNDAVQWTGGADRWWVHHSDFVGHLQIGAPFGSLTDIRLEDYWNSASPNFGVIYEAYTGKSVSGSRTRGHSWGHRYGDRSDFVDGRQYAPGSASSIRVSDSAITTSAPPAGTANPADVWRAANPYGSYRSYLRIG